MISHIPDGAPELHYMETMSYEEYLSALVPKDREYDRYAGAWNEMLAESFDAFLGLGLIYKAVTGEEAFTGDKLTQNEREEAAASGAFALTVSVLTSAIGGTGWSGFATMLLADAAGGVVGVVTYEGLTNMGLSDSEAFLLSFFAGVVTGNGIERMACSSPTYIDDLAKRMGKSSDEVVDMLGDLSDVAAKYNYSSVDDMLNNLSPAARDDIMKMFDKPLGSFDLDKVDDFKVKNQVFDAKKSYKEILKNPDDIKQIAKNTGLDTEDVKKVKDYLFKEKHLMPDGTYRQFDASEEVADAWKRLTNGKATDDDILLFNHELTELRFVEEGFSVDAAHILSSVDYNWSSVSKIDDFARKCSEIYGKDFYFGAGTSNEAIDAIVKQLDNLDGQVDDGLDIIDEIKRVDEINVEFNYKSKYDESEFAQQLAEQQKGMNELTVQEYLDNRQKYIEQGRAIESNAAQQAAREKAFIDKVDELQDEGLSLKEAEEQAQKWIDTQAALHNPDQVAGGHTSNIGGVGDKRVNSSIGSQWRYRIDAVDEQIQKMAESMSKEERNSTYLNVNLIYKGV